MRTAPNESRPSPRRPALLLALLAACLLSSTAPALGDVGETIIQRCTHGQSLSGFSQSDYTQALKQLSADAEEYTDCSSLIRKAQLAAAGGLTTTTPSAEAAVAIAATPAEQQAIAHAARSGSEPVNIEGHLIRPGVVHANISSAVSSLPTPLFAILAFLLAAVLLLVSAALRNRFGARHPD